MSYQKIIDELVSAGDKKIAEHSQRFFKTGKGEYGEGDIFLGIRVPVVRQAVKRHKAEPLETAQQLLTSEYHEVRLFAVLLLVTQFIKANSAEQKVIYKTYLNNTAYINNWDIVDSSAHYLVGAYLQDKDRTILYELAKSESLWERRIGIMSTFYCFSSLVKTMHFSARL